MKDVWVCRVGVGVLAVCLLVLSCSTAERFSIQVEGSEVGSSPVVSRPVCREEVEILAELPMVHRRSMVPIMEVGDGEDYFYPGAFTVPIQIKGTEYAFIVDTGSNLTLLDAGHRSLLGEPLFTRNAAASFTPYEASFYRLTGGIDVGRVRYSNSIGCIKMRESTGLDIDGLIGRDILELDGHVVQFDFAEKRLRIMRVAGPAGWKADVVEADRGIELALSRPDDALGCVSVDVALSEDITEPLIIDSGLWGPSYLRREVFEMLKEDPDVKVVRSGDTELLYMRRLPIGGVDVSDVYFMANEKLDGSYLGVQFLGRFSKVTIDFDRGKVFLVPQITTARELLLEDGIIDEDMLSR